MTLRSASARTISWIDSEAKRLLQRRGGLCSDIKFQDVHKALERAGISQPQSADDPRHADRGACRRQGQPSRLYAEVALEAILVRCRS